MSIKNRKIAGGALTPVYGAGGTINAKLVGTIGGETDQPLPLDPTLGALEVVSQGEVAALNQLVVCRWVNDVVPGAAQTVLTNGPAGVQPGVYYNLRAGEIVMVTLICMELTTTSDTVNFELGYTDAINGGGTFRPLTPERILRTGAAFVSFDGIEFQLDPPLPIRYDAGARSITFRVNCNDAGATITPSWHGFIVQT